MNLTIDIGNSAAKFVLFDGDKPVCIKSNSKNSGIPLNELLQSYTIDHAIGSCVSEYGLHLQRSIRRLNCPFFWVTPETKLPIKITYRTPQTLGSDRVAAIIGAQYQNPVRDILVIDLGTCITYDVITADSQFVGGNISPGVSMRFRAMHDRTSHLPLADLQNKMKLPSFGTTTTEALQCGVLEGIKGEIIRSIDNMKRAYPDTLVYLTGGDADKFADLAKAYSLLCDEYLVARGLNRILQYNESI